MRPPIAGHLLESGIDDGAKPPRHLSAWVGRLLVGESGVAMMTEARGASNAKARRELGWQPAYRDWHLGFHTIAAPSAARRVA